MSDTREPLSTHEEKFTHQTDVVSVAGILRTGAALALLVVVSMIGMVGLFRVLDRSEDVALPDWAVPPLETGPPFPQLDPDQPDQLRRLRAAHRRTLSTYGWVDEKAGIARIPIDRAIDMLVEEQLPARNPTRER